MLTSRLISAWTMTSTTATLAPSGQLGLKVFTTGDNTRRKQHLESSLGWRYKIKCFLVFNSPSTPPVPQVPAVFSSLKRLLTIKTSSPTPSNPAFYTGVTLKVILAVIFVHKNRWPKAKRTPDPATSLVSVHKDSYVPNSIKTNTMKISTRASLPPQHKASPTASSLMRLAQSR